MNPRVVWPVLGLAGLLGLMFAVSITSAQRPIPLPGMMYPSQPGRFVVAHGSEKLVLVLDTTNGTVYAIKDSDFKKASDLSKALTPMVPIAPPLPKDGPLFKEKKIEKDAPPPVRGRPRDPSREER